MRGYSVCGKMVGNRARWHYTLGTARDEHGNEVKDNLVRQWWPGEGIWGELQEWTDGKFVKVPEEHISTLFPPQSDSLQ